MMRAMDDMHTNAMQSCVIHHNTVMRSHVTLVFWVVLVWVVLVVVAE